MARNRLGERVPCSAPAFLTVAAVPFTLSRGSHLLTLVAKLTLSLESGERALITEEPLLLDGDVYRGEPESSSLLTASDFAPLKRRVDVTLVGHAYAPHGRATTGRVALEIGDSERMPGRRLHREIAVFGPRMFARGGVGVTDPAPFERVPLIYENAFGGLGFAHNPVGKGIAGERVPELEDPSSLVKTTLDRPMPACFAPIAPAWEPRRSRLGTYDERYVAERWPYTAADFDVAHYQAAPVQLEALHGDELLTLTGVREDPAPLVTRLPGVRVRARFVRTASTSVSSEPLELRIDTLHIDADARVATLTFRASVSISEARAPELDRVLFECTDASGAALPNGVPEIPAAAAEGETTPPEILVARHLEAAGLSSAAALAARTTVARDEILAGHAELDGRDFAGVDLSGADLRGRSFAKAVLVGARLSGALLAGCDLSGAQLLGADLEGADLSGAKLEGADLTGAKLTAARLNQAKVGRAVFRKAHAAGATFDAVTGESAAFVEADLAGASFVGADLKASDFTRAKLEGASFADAKLHAVRLYEAHATGASFAKAELPGARGEEAHLDSASFEQANLEGSVLDAANVERANFSGALMKEVGLRHASCRGATFNRADLRASRLASSDFTSAKLAGANLMKATFEAATLERTDLRGANLHGAEFLEAKIRDLQLDGAILTDTKLASRSS
ncbi:MAG: DUF2169 domain-containing protein [Polyangiaceae bacterium]